MSWMGFRLDYQETIGRLCSVLLVAWLLSACGGPASPSSGNSTPAPGGSTTFSLGGKVTDSTSGSAIGGATVAVVGGPDAGKSTTTDTSGNYSFTGLQQASFSVSVTATDYAAQSKDVGLTGSNQTVSFQMTRQVCSFALSISGTVAMSVDGGSLSASVTTGSFCTWTPSVSVTWMRVQPAVAAVSGSGSFTLTIDPNGFPSDRTGTVTVGDKSFAVSQVAGPSSVKLGITVDYITIPHGYIVGAPIQTPDTSVTYCCWPYPVKTPDTYVFDEAEFPTNEGIGSSKVITKAGMIFVGLNTLTNPAAIRYIWYKATGTGTDKVIYDTTLPSSYTATWSYVSHFPNVVDDPGQYYVAVVTPWGNTGINFRVTDSTQHASSLSPRFFWFAPWTGRLPPTQPSSGGVGAGGR